MVVVGCCSSVAECLCEKQVVMGSIPNDSQTFLNSVLFKMEPVTEREYTKLKKYLYLYLKYYI